jgi:hypothetical protein
VALTDAQQLRALLGEDIPVGGVDTDTLFTDAEITEMLSTFITPVAAEGYGWKVKAAKLSNLVDIVEGSTSRDQSQAFEHAVKMAEQFGGAGMRGPARIHRISRD